MHAPPPQIPCTFDRRMRAAWADPSPGRQPPLQDMQPRQEQASQAALPCSPSTSARAPERKFWKDRDKPSERGWDFPQRECPDIRDRGLPPAESGTTGVRTQAGNLAPLMMGAVSRVVATAGRPRVSMAWLSLWPLHGGRTDGHARPSFLSRVQDVSCSKHAPIFVQPCSVTHEAFILHRGVGETATSCPDKARRVAIGKSRKEYASPSHQDPLRLLIHLVRFRTRLFPALVLAFPSENTSQIERKTTVLEEHAECHKRQQNHTGRRARLCVQEKRLAPQPTNLRRRSSVKTDSRFKSRARTAARPVSMQPRYLE